MKQGFALNNTHVAQFYDSVEFLSASLAEYLKIGVEKNEGLLLISNPSTWLMVKNDLQAQGISAKEWLASGRLIFIDAERMGSAILSGRGFEKNIFLEFLDSEVEKLFDKHTSVRAYCELVNILCARGEKESALSLENYWNEYLETHPRLALMCGYAKALFRDPKDPMYKALVSAHTDVIESENVDCSVADHKLLRRLGMLEQRALELKIERRDRVEQEAHFEEVVRGLTNISTFSSLNQICLLLAHKIRNPLQIIRGTAEQIMRSSQQGVDQQLLLKGAQRIENSTEAIAELVQNVLETTGEPQN